MLFECKVPFHTRHQIRHVAYRFRRLFSLAVASPFYSWMYIYLYFTLKSPFLRLRCCF